MKRVIITIALLHFGFCLDATGAPEKENSTTGNVGVGVMFMNLSDNLDPHGSKKLQNNLESEPDSELTVLPYIMPTLEYDIGESGGGKIYLNTRPALEEAGGFAINLGGSTPLDNAGIIDGSIFFTPFDKVWKDPYLTDTGRESTSMVKYGGKLAMNKILGTTLNLNAVFMKSDIEDDVIGTLQDDLARDGALYALSASYGLFSSPTFELRPHISVGKGEYDGESNSFVKGKFDLEVRYTMDRLTFLPRISYSHSTYDKSDPIFAETRKNDSYGAMMLVSYAAPFNLEDWALQGLIGYRRGESNITFYDTESVMSGVFMSYRF